MAVIISPRRGVDWKEERSKIDLGLVATNLLGPAPGRRGERGRRLWWSCPFHEDRNPSFCVDSASGFWHCFGCGEHGDAANLVMRIQGVSFPEAVSILTGKSTGKTVANALPKPRPKPKAETTPDPSEMTYEAAVGLVKEAADRLQGPDGLKAREYLTGPHRSLSLATIEAAELGRAGPLDLPGRPRGIVIPWRTDSRLTLVKIRQPEWRKPKYVEVFRDRTKHLGIYPDAKIIKRGQPLVIVEGEFDCLCLGEVLGDLASVVSLGSASSRPTPEILARMLRAAPWFAAMDNDPAGNQAAEAWPRAKRVRPPGQFKDWCEAREGRINLRRWWGEVLSGTLHPSMFTSEELDSWRWGPALEP